MLEQCINQLKFTHQHQQRQLHNFQQVLLYTTKTVFDENTTQERSEFNGELSKLMQNLKVQMKQVQL